MSLRDDLGAVPWAEMTHAYGLAADTPGALLELLSEDADTREIALEQLWPSICHQGSIYEASCAAIPFLIRILREGPVEGRPEILTFLDRLASRHTYAMRGTRILQIKREFMRESGSLEEEHVWWSPDTFLQHGSQYYDPQLIARAHALVAEGIPDYIAIIEEDGADPELTRAALRLLSGFGEQAERITPAFEAILREAPYGRAEDARVEAEALFSLAALLPPGAPGWERYASILASSDPPARPPVRYAAAAALATYHPAALPPEGVDTLIEAMIAPDELDEFSLRFVDKSVHHDAYLLLGGLGAPAGTAALARALALGAKDWYVLNTFLVAEALLDTAFFGSPVRNRYRSVSTAFQPRPTLPGHLDWFYGQHSGSFFDNADIDFSGYVEEEAAQIRQRVARDGVSALSPDERFALATVVACEPLWLASHNLLDIYGLPRERDALAALLASGS